MGEQRKKRSDPPRGGKTQEYRSREDVERKKVGDWAKKTLYNGTVSIENREE